jgi:hypothetical protein
MSRMIRPVLLLVIVVAGLVGIPGAASASFAAQDGNVLGIASMRLGHQSMGRVLGWLRHQPSVRSALRGRWPDGGHSLPRRVASCNFAEYLQSGTATSGPSPSPPATALARALRRRGPRRGDGAVCNSVRTRPQAGDAEVGDLQSAGYSVDQLYDTQVTLKALTTLSQYNVAYMQTHAGVVTGVRESWPRE